LKLSRPPVLATWLFEHLTRREHRDALYGDLFEKYGRRRSDTWYWRQVLAAIAADFSTEFRSRWLSVVFAVVVCGMIPWKPLFLNTTFQSFLFSGIQMTWPVSFLVDTAIISAFQGAILLAALSVFVFSANRFQPHAFRIAFCYALLVLSLGNTVVALCQVLPWPRPLFYYVIWRLPLFFSLVLSTWLMSAIAPRAGASRLTI